MPKFVVSKGQRETPGRRQPGQPNMPPCGRGLLGWAAQGVRVCGLPHEGRPLARGAAGPVTHAAGRHRPTTNTVSNGVSVATHWACP